MNYEEERQKKIEEAIKNKELRFSKTEVNIEISWSINCVIASFSFIEKLLPWKKRFGLMEKRYQDIIDLKRSYLLENMPAPERLKLTREDFTKAKAEAPQSQAEQNVADSIEPEEVNRELEEVVIPETEIPPES